MEESKQLCPGCFSEGSCSQRSQGQGNGSCLSCEGQLWLRTSLSLGLSYPHSRAVPEEGALWQFAKDSSQPFGPTGHMSGTGPSAGGMEPWVLAQLLLPPTHQGWVPETWHHFPCLPHTGTGPQGLGTIPSWPLTLGLGPGALCSPLLARCAGTGHWSPCVGPRAPHRSEDLVVGQRWHQSLTATSPSPWAAP